MNFLPNDTLAGLAHTSADLRARMVDHHAVSPGGRGHQPCPPTGGDHPTPSDANRGEQS